MTSCRRLRMVGYESPISCSIRLILPSQRTNVKINSICSGVRFAKCPEAKWPSMDVSQFGQCNRTTSSSDSQIGQRVGAGRIVPPNKFSVIARRVFACPDALSGSRRSNLHLLVRDCLVTVLRLRYAPLTRAYAYLPPGLSVQDRLPVGTGSAGRTKFPRDDE